MKWLAVAWTVRPKASSCRDCVAGVRSVSACRKCYSLHSAGCRCRRIAACWQRAAACATTMAEEGCDLVMSTWLVARTLSHSRELVIYQARGKQQVAWSKGGLRDVFQMTRPRLLAMMMMMMAKLKLRNDSRNTQASTPTPVSQPLQSSELFLSLL
jgi:hypothetical protein